MLDTHDVRKYKIHYAVILLVHDFHLRGQTNVVYV